MAIKTENEDELIHLIALKAVSGLGPILCRNLVAYCGSAKNVFSKNKSQLEKIPGIGNNTAHAIRNATQNIAQAEIELSYYQKNNISVIPYFDTRFPTNLKEIPDSPVVLYIQGETKFNDQIFVSIVGTRTPTEYGRKQAARFTECLSAANINIVSGLAFGIDAEAHKTALANNALTTAVIAHGLDRIYPQQHKQLAQKIIDSGGSIISEYPVYTKPEPVFFPARNRIIAGLSIAVIVVEAAHKGGALITARLAFDYDRDVYAVPGNLGNKTSEGCNALIQKNIAKIIINPEDLLTEIMPVINSPKPKIATSLLLTQEQQIVLNVLADQTLALDKLHDLTQISIGNLISIMLELEFSGLVKQLPGRLFVKI
ncbi:MAG: DNA-processing protein DprA [Bacteroidia bacterium]|nr:DNA-processing protein DprA [Bacteroidia bacterium]